MKSIILLSGPIGAGKTTVAPELVACSPEPVAYIEGDKFWQFIAKGDSRNHKNFQMIMRSMMAAAVPDALSGYETILDFSMPPWFLDTARKIAGMREVPLEYVVLRPSLEVCVHRAANRMEGQINSYSHYKELYDDFDEVPKYIIHDDTSDASVIAAKIRKGLNAGLFRLK